MVQYASANGITQPASPDPAPPPPPEPAQSPAEAPISSPGETNNPTDKPSDEPEKSDEPSPPAAPSGPPAASALSSRFREEIDILANIARRGARYQAAFLALLDAYAAIARAMAQALNHLQPTDMADAGPVKDRLTENLLSAERALAAQQPAVN